MLHARGLDALALTAATILVACSHTPAVPDGGGSAPDGAVACPDAYSNPAIAELPQGKPCASTAGACTLTLDTPCGSPEWESPGTTNGWTCGCKDGRWDCVITSEGTGGGTCLPCAECLPDAPLSLSGSCIGCCDTLGDLDGCFIDHCESYFVCLYCKCAAGDTACQTACDSDITPACHGCLQSLAACENGSKCASACVGDPYHDAGPPEDDGLED